MQLTPAVMARLAWARMTKLRRDGRGAALVQFIAILPALIIVVYGAWALFVVMSAHQALCDAAWQASRHLQVEGLRFPEHWIYPDDWERVALDIAVDATANERSLREQIWSMDNVMVWPRDRMPVAPRNPDMVVKELLRYQQFNVRVSQEITNPLGVFFPTAPRLVDPDDPDSDVINPERRARMTLSCQVAGYVEGPPFRPTNVAQPGAPPCIRCPDSGLPRCTPGPGPTACPGGGSNPNCPTPLACPICCN